MEQIPGFFLLLWQFPQVLAGAFMVLVLGAKKRKTLCGNYTWYWFSEDTKFKKFISGVSLAMFTLLKREDLITIKHEYGHYKQSQILGPLYLFVIGIPSARGNLKHRKLIQEGKIDCRYDNIYHYYITQWWEKWADELGGVDRIAQLRGILRPPNAVYPKV